MSKILLDPYSSRSLDEYVNLRVPIETFMLSKVFTTHRGHATDTVDYEEYSYTNRRAKMIDPDATEPKQIKKSTKKKLRTYTIPRTFESRVFSAKEIDDMAPAGNLYGSQEARNKYAQDIIADEVEDLQDRVVNLQESLACEAILTGKQTITDDGYEYNYDYGFEDGKQLFTVSTKWTASAGNPITDIKGMKAKIRKACGMNPDLLVVGSAVAKIMLENDKVLKYLDNLNTKVGTIDLNTMNEMSSMAELLSPNFLGMKWYEYNQQYTNDSNQLVDMMPENGFAMIATKSKGFILHKGVIYRLDEKGRKIPMSQDYYLTSDLNKRRNGLSWELEQKSIPMIHDKGAVISANVIGA